MAQDPTDLAAKAERIKARLNGQRQRPPAWVDAMAMIGEDEPAYEWLIADLLERQGRILLAAEEGTGKSLLALTAAVQAASGRSVLEAFDVSLPRRVVYFDLEMPRSSTRRRLRSLSISAGLESGALELVMRPDGLSFDSNREQEEVMEHLRQIRPELVVVDPLYKATMRNLNHDEDLRPTLRFIDRIRAEFGAGFLICHHLRKRAQGEQGRGRDTSDIFGSSVLLRWPEMILALDEERIRVLKDRDGVLAGIRSFTVARGGTWPISVVNPQTRPEAEALEHIETFGPLSSNQVVSGVGGTRAHVLEAIRGLEAKGKVRRVGSKWEATD